MKKVTSSERIDNLTALSDAVYDAIDQYADDGERRYRRMLRLGMYAVVQSLTAGTIRYAGDVAHRALQSELVSGDLSIDHPVYDAYPTYRTIVQSLPRAPLFEAPSPEIIKLASDYADVTRATLTLDNEQETDARHAVHLATLALPYAAEYYPHLDPSKIALYCLLHDILEAYAGDVPTLGLSDEGMRAKNQAEVEALTQLELDFVLSYPNLIHVIHHYELLNDDEARYVKTFDKLDPGFTHLYSNGNVLTAQLGIYSASEFFRQVDETTKRMIPYSNDFLELLRDREELTHRIADATNWPE